ncbi:hypothetical protein P354_01595 [Streptomyces noursei PD-1]|nr:hypothetical protein P354_01595 [Streptomyces noursei PD-1]
MFHCPAQPLPVAELVRFALVEGRREQYLEQHDAGEGVPAEVTVTCEPEASLRLDQFGTPKVQPHSGRQ